MLSSVLTPEHPPSRFIITIRLKKFKKKRKNKLLFGADRQLHMASVLSGQHPPPPNIYLTHLSGWCSMHKHTHTPMLMDFGTLGHPPRVMRLPFCLTDVIFLRRQKTEGERRQRHAHPHTPAHKHTFTHEHTFTHVHFPSQASLVPTL